MASSTLTLYCTNAVTKVFTLVGVLADGARYMVSGRAIACPFVTEIKRKFNPNGTGNDHVGIRIARTEQNTTSGKLATCQVLLDISIPKDQSVLTPAVQKEILALLASALNENAAVASTTVNASALIEGRDL